MGNRGKSKGQILVTLFSLCILCIGVFFCRNKIREEVEIQLQENLRDVAMQNDKMVEKEIQEKIRVLQVIAGDLTAMRDDKRIRYVAMLKPISNSYGFKRVGYIQGNGKSHTTDAFHKSVSASEYFHKSINGETCITDVLIDTIGAESEVNIFSVPVYSMDGSNINGVVYATYQSEEFQKLISRKTFEEKGCSCVIQEDGHFVARSDNFPKNDMFANLFTLLDNESIENSDAIDQLKRTIENKQSENVSFLLKGAKYAYCTPISYQIGGKDCYLITIVPSVVLEERVVALENYMNLLMGVLLIAFIIVGLTYIYSFHKKRENLRRLAYVDPVTGGDNYAFFEEKMEQAKNSSGYLIAMDIRDFKIVNQTCGAEKGNETILEVYQIIKNSLKQEEQVARINAGKYAIFYLEDEKEQLIAKLETITKEVEQLSEKLNIPRISAYYGVYYIQEKIEDLEMIFNFANEAKYVASEKETTNYAFYEEVDFQQINNERELSNRFDSALQNEEFEIWYQPKYCAKNRTIDGAEALVRWRREDGTMIPPFQFIPLFEKNGMIARLDEYVFRKVCRQQKEWKDAGMKLLPISINVSRATLYYANVVDKYKDIVRKYGVEPEYVPLEITESAMIDNADIRMLVDKFRSAGFPLHLDDFGNGYSSLASLNVLNFDTLKIDKSLVDHIGDEKGDKLLYFVIQLARSIGMKVTAEGVETEEQLNFLQEMECTNIQGYFFSKPLPLMEFQKKYDECRGKI